MPTLLLATTCESAGIYGIEVVFGNGSMPCRISRARLTFTLSEQEQEDLRWYFEDYLQYPFEPAPTIANRIEERIAELGTYLFSSVFQSSADAQKLWEELRDHTSNTRIEVIVKDRESANIPWELLQDPSTNIPLAVLSPTFVRTGHHTATELEIIHRVSPGISQIVPDQTPLIANATKLMQPIRNTSLPIRVLLVISRPKSSDDVPFRSVANRLIKSLSQRGDFDLDVLRPPTFTQLIKQLDQAKTEGRPYHVVHFDGHGIYEDLQAKYAGQPPRRKRGYLIFENPEDQESPDPRDGKTLGQYLVQAGVPLLILNACRSAHTEPPPEPTKGNSDNRVRAFGSLAQELVEAGVLGVVAMRYNIYVTTAAEFVADLYANLVNGLTLGEAVTQGRKKLFEQPLREIAYLSRHLQDWFVPIVYETVPIALFPLSTLIDNQTSHLSSIKPVSPNLIGVPASPETGFWGRDETLLELDRAFNQQNIVLLHAFAGHGKSATAAEFARWYSLTGGVDGPVLFTSFERYLPLVRLLDTIEVVFRDKLEQQGIDWLRLSFAERRSKALELLKNGSILWVWDNVEAVAGFPAGTESTWSSAEQQELVDFLHEARDTKAKFLLTSRRDERDWLDNLSLVRLLLPPMRMPERIQLAKSIASRNQQSLSNIIEWLPLLEYTQGNPLTIIVMVGQALRDRLNSKEQIDHFIAKLRAGEAAFDDNWEEGRAKSLGASLSYGFEHAFSPDERKLLALLSLFQGFVDVTTLYYMGHPETGDLPLINNWTRETRISLLNRAVEIGLLTAYRGGAYGIHPVLPWFFKRLFDQYYPPSPLPGEKDSNLWAIRAFVFAVGTVGVYYQQRYYKEGALGVIDPLRAEEGNLLYARALARANCWWTALISTMQGLETLYSHTGRHVEWERLVNEIAPDFIDPFSDGPLPGREADWSLMIEYRVGLALKARQLMEAERLQLIRVKWERENAFHALTVPVNKLDNKQSRAIQSLAVSLSGLGYIMLEKGQPDCVSIYKEATQLYQLFGEVRNQSSAASSLGDAYKDIPTIRDLEQSEQWYQRSLDLLDEHDHLGRSRRLTSLGDLAYERYKETLASDGYEDKLRLHVEAAAQFYERALILLPSDAVDDLGVAHNQLGVFYDTLGETGKAFSHYRDAIHYQEQQGNLYGAASTRMNVARALRDEGRYTDAQLYIEAALSNYEVYGERAAAEVQQARKTLEDIVQVKNSTQQQLRSFSVMSPM